VVILRVVLRRASHPSPEPELSRCPYEREPGGGCDGDGWLIDEEANVTRECRCRPERIRRTRSARLSRELPERFQQITLDDQRLLATVDEAILREVRNYVRRIDRELEEGNGLFFFGDRGAGKTTLAMAIAREVLRTHAVAIYNARELVSTLHLASTDGYGGDNVLERLDRYAAVDLLYIDDLAVTTSHDWIQQLLYSVINRRYETKGAMLITADVESPEKLADHIGWRSASRLLEVCEPIPIFGKDRRIVASPSSG